MAHSYARLLDAGLHPEVANRATAQSIDPSQVIAVINQILAVFTSGGANIVEELLTLLGLFGVPIGKATRPATPAIVTRQQLLLAGLDEKLLQKAEAMAVAPGDILGWITTIFNIITVAGPSLLAAISAILNAFVVPTPPAPAPTTPGASPDLGSKSSGDIG